NPLNTLGMTIALLGRGNASQDTVARGERAIERISEMNEQLVTFGRIVLGTGLKLRLDGARIDDLVRSVLPQEERITFAPSGAGQGRWDVEQVQRAVRELLHNAIDHGGPGPISVIAAADDKWASVTVESAAPVQPELRDLVFEPVERAARART